MFLNGQKAFQFVCRWPVRAVNFLLCINIIMKIVAYFSCLSGLLRNYCDLRSQLKFVVRGGYFCLNYFWKGDSLSGYLQLIPITLCIRELIH